MENCGCEGSKAAALNPQGLPSGTRLGAEPPWEGAGGTLLAAVRGAAPHSAGHAAALWSPGAGAPGRAALLGLLEHEHSQAAGSCGQWNVATSVPLSQQRVRTSGSCLWATCWWFLRPVHLVTTLAGWPVSSDL